jgi:hypothetical protein
VPRRDKETVAASNSQGGIPPGAGAAPNVMHREMAQNTVQGEKKAATPLETKAGRRVDTEKQRAAEAKTARAEALAELNWERQLRLAAEELRIAADKPDLAECLKTDMGLLTREQVERVTNAVRGTTRGPMEALRGLST